MAGVTHLTLSQERLEREYIKAMTKFKKEQLRIAGRICVLINAKKKLKLPNT